MEPNQVPAEVSLNAPGRDSVFFPPNASSFQISWSVPEYKWDVKSNLIGVPEGLLPYL